MQINEEVTFIIVTINGVQKQNQVFISVSPTNAVHFIG